MNAQEEVKRATERVNDFEIWRKREYAEKFEKMGDFYDGYQWQHTGNVPQYAVTSNDTLANVDIKCRALAFDDPEAVVQSLDGPNEEGERIWQGVLRSTFRYCHANKEIKKVIRWTNVIGFAATLAYWDEKTGWPKLKAIDPRTIAFDPEMEDWDNPEWVAICSYLPKWELERQFGKAPTEGLAPDIVRRRGDEIGATLPREHIKTYVERIKVWEYWQREGRRHIVWAEQRQEKPLIYHEISDVDEAGPDPTFPEGLIIPLRFLLAVPAINELLPHSYVELGYETQVRLNEAMTSLVQAYKRLVPSMVTRKGTFDTTEKRKMMDGEIGEVYEVSEDVQVLGDSIQNMPNPTMNASIYPHLERLEQQIRMYQNVTEYHQGVQVGSRTTATEAQGRMRFSGIRGRGEEQDLREHIADCFHMLRDMWLYYAPDTLVRYEDAASQTQFQPMNRMAMEGVGGPRLDFPAYITVRESSTLRKDSALEQQAKLQLFSTLLPAVPGLAQMGIPVNVKKLIDDLLRSFDVQDINAYYSEAPPPGLDILAGQSYNQGALAPDQDVSEAGRIGNPLEGLGI